MTLQASKNQRGTSIVEFSVAAAITAIVTGLVAPEFDHMLSRHRVEGTAGQIETEMQYARSAAVALNRTVHMAFSDEGGATCYVIHTGHRGDCTCIEPGRPVCLNGAEALSTQQFERSAPLRVTANVRSMAFDADWGTVTPTATLTVKDTRGESIRLIVNIMGRIRSCSPTPGFPSRARC
jgi:type IV fimbrial biogenesis protein FimT